MTRRSSAALTTRSRVITPVATLIGSPLLRTAPALDAYGLTAKARLHKHGVYQSQTTGKCWILLAGIGEDEIRSWAPEPTPARPKALARRGRCWSRGGRPCPAPGACAETVYARLRAASMAPSSQMLCFRVSGITKIAMRNMMAGTAMGEISAYPTLPVERYIEVVTIGTSPPPQPLPMW